MNQRSRCINHSHRFVIIGSQCPAMNQTRTVSAKLYGNMSASCYKYFSLKQKSVHMITQVLTLDATKPVVPLFEKEGLMTSVLEMQS